MARFAFKSLSPRKVLCSTYSRRYFDPNYGVVFREISHPRMYNTLLELLYEAFFHIRYLRAPNYASILAADPPTLNASGMQGILRLVVYKAHQ